MKILVITANYPSKLSPQRGTFVYQLVQKFIQLGNDVTVIAPEPIKLIYKYPKTAYGVEKAKVFRPKYLSASNKKILNFNSYSIARFSQISAIKNIIRKREFNFDVVYCHFISNALITVEAIGKYNKPIFVAVGEYKGIDIVRGYYPWKKYELLINKIKGFIAVSPQVKDKLLEIGINEKQIFIAPNSVDLKQFRVFDKMRMREKYNLPKDKKIVLFVGRFLFAKGAIRVLKALEKLPNSVLGIFVGKGKETPNGDKVIFAGPLLHQEIPEIMNAADVFVLPTLHEGSCNAIVEAMACGLPIISSNLPEIKVQCNPEFSILVDPLNVSEIQNAIEKILSNDNRRNKMSAAALKYSKNFDLDKRAEKILNFISESILM